MSCSILREKDIEYELVESDEGNESSHSTVHCNDTHNDNNRKRNTVKNKSIHTTSPSKKQLTHRKTKKSGKHHKKERYESMSGTRNVNEEVKEISAWSSKKYTISGRQDKITSHDGHLIRKRKADNDYSEVKPPKVHCYSPFKNSNLVSEYCSPLKSSKSIKSNEITTLSPNSSEEKRENAFTTKNVPSSKLISAKKNLFSPQDSKNLSYEISHNLKRCSVSIKEEEIVDCNKLNHIANLRNYNSSVISSPQKDKINILGQSSKFSPEKTEIATRKKLLEFDSSDSEISFEKTLTPVKGNYGFSSSCQHSSEEESSLHPRLTIDSRILLQTRNNNSPNSKIRSGLISNTSEQVVSKQVVVTPKKNTPSKTEQELSCLTIDMVDKTLKSPAKQDQQYKISHSKHQISRTLINEAEESKAQASDKSKTVTTPLKANSNFSSNSTKSASPKKGCTSKMSTNSKSERELNRLSIDMVHQSLKSSVRQKRKSEISYTNMLKGVKTVDDIEEPTNQNSRLIKIAPSKTKKTRCSSDKNLQTKNRLPKLESNKLKINANERFSTSSSNTDSETMSPRCHRKIKLKSYLKERSEVFDHDSDQSEENLKLEHKSERNKFLGGKENSSPLKYHCTPNKTGNTRSDNNSFPLSSPKGTPKGSRMSNQPQSVSSPLHKQCASVTTPVSKKSTGRGFLTPSMARKERGEINKVEDDLDMTRRQLHISTIPKSLPCRDAEFSQIRSFLLRKIEHSVGGCMYISGVPGTGKTATVHAVIRSLQTEADKGEIPEFDFVEVNGLRLTEPKQAYVRIYQALTDRKVAPDQAQQLLNMRFSSSCKRSTIILVDELDYLCNRRQDVVYNILDWPSKSSSRLVVLAISNTMDLPERTLKGRVTSRMGLTRLAFQPYSHHQLGEIVCDRLSGTTTFHPDAIQLVARKVAAVSGDARRALDICRRTTELVVSEEGGQVTVSHVEQALTQIFSGPRVLVIQSLGRLAQLVLRALRDVNERSGVDETTALQVYRHLEQLCALEGYQLPPVGSVLETCVSLVGLGLIVAEKGRVDVCRKMSLNVSSDDIHYALESIKSL